MFQKRTGARVSHKSCRWWWWIQRLQWWQSFELVLTPFLHTPHGYLLGLTGYSVRGLLTSILVLDMLTGSPFASKLSFQAVNWFSNQSKDSSIITKSSGDSNSHGHPRRQSWDNASITVTSSKGLRNEPWWIPNLTPVFSLKVLFTRTLDEASTYIAWTNLIFHSSIPSFRVSYQMTFLGTLSKVFARYTKAK